MRGVRIGHSKLHFSFGSTARPLQIAPPVLCINVYSVLILRNERTQPCAARLSKKYGGPEGRPSRTFPRERSLSRRSSRTFTPPLSFTNVLSRTFPYKRSLANVLSRKFSRERFFASVLSSVALCEHSLTKALSIAESSWLAAAVELPSVTGHA